MHVAAELRKTKSDTKLQLSSLTPLEGTYSGVQVPELLYGVTPPVVVVSGDVPTMHVS